MSLKVLVIGAGPGGYAAAIRAAQMGGEVTLVEREGVGGTCLHWGCIPSKVLKTTADLLAQLRRAEEFGIALSGPVACDMKALMARKQRVVESQVKGITDLLQHNRIRLVRGSGFVAKTNLAEVKTSQGEMLPVPWDRLILAPGSTFSNLPGAAFDGKKVLSSNDALCLEEVPGSLLILGGGAIGCEFAFIFHSLGCRVTLVEGLSRLLPLPSVDADCSVVIQREMKKQRIPFMVNTTVERLEVEGEKVRAVLADVGMGKEKKGAAMTLEVDAALVCIGRKAHAEDLGLKGIGVETDERGWIRAGEDMQTSAPHVYAIGDALGPEKIMLAHVAAREGMVAAENAMGQKAAMDYRAVPSVIFTMPEVANVGMTEAQSREAGVAVRTDKVLFRSLGKPHVLGEIAGEVKIVSHAESGKVLGVHLVGPHASDLIAEATLAVQTGCTTGDLARTIHAHPTLAEVVGEAALKAVGRPIHG